MVLFGSVAIFGQYGSAFLERGRYQRVADLAATAAAQRMQADYPRLFAPPVLPGGAPNPMHMSRVQYIANARRSATKAAAVNHAGNRLKSVSFGVPPAPASVTVSISGTHDVDVPLGASRASTGVSLRAKATARLAFSLGDLPGPLPATASGGGY